MDKAKKKQIKKLTTWVLVAAMVAGLAAMPLLAKAEAEADGPVATVHSGTVETGTIGTTLHGGGTLSTEDVEAVKIPSDVKITEFLVKNGDTVTEGTPLAVVDKVSVMTAITEVTDTMEYLQKEIRNAKDDKVSSTISATAGGRVKKVFAQKGDSVQDVMLRDGALALLSLDGLMAVQIEQKLDLPTGDTVTVTFEQEEEEVEVSGRVASNLDGVITITIEDEGYAIGLTANVAKDGKEIGSGELYVHNAWTATAFSGTIQNVRAKEETKVSAGSTLFTLTDTDFQGTLDYLASLHRDYEELMQDLFKMYNSGTIEAPCDGTISGIDKDSAHLLGADEGHWQITLLDERPVQSFVAFAAKVTGISGNTWQLAVDPGLIRLETLHDLCLTPTDPAAMTHSRSYPAETVCTQNASGALVPNGSASVGDTLLFVGDESGVIWVVDVEESVPTTAYGVVLMTGQLPPDAGINTNTCDPTKDEQCPALANHKPECIKACQNNGRCTATNHYPECIGSCTSGTACGAKYHTSKCIMSCDSGNTDAECDGTLHHKSDCIKDCDQVKDENSKCSSTKHYFTCIESCIQSDGTKDCPALVHQKTCIEACTHQGEKDTQKCPATRHYTDCIECCIKSESAEEVCPSAIHKEGCFFYKMTYTARVAMVFATGNTELVVRWDASEKEYDVEKVGTGWKFSTDQGFNLDLLVNQGTIAVSNPGNYRPGDVIFVVTGYKGKDAVWTGIPVYIRGAGKVDDSVKDALGGLGDLSGMLSMPSMDLSSLLGGFSGFGNFGFYSTAPVEESQLFDLEGDTLMTVSPQKNMTVTINLDEQDIAKVRVGQTATVKVEALGEEQFDASIIQISTRGNNSGGSSKFPVKLRLEKQPNMLDGMSATVTIPLEEQNDVLLVPVKALAEQGAQTVLYTALDEEGNPANPVPITTGVSDGINVQVLSGAEEGMTFYYSYYDTYELDTSVEDRFTLN